MPLQCPETDSGNDAAKRSGMAGCVKRICRKLTATSALSVSAGLAFLSTAHAQAPEGLTTAGKPAVNGILSSLRSLDSFEILLLAIFGGAMSFALLSAFWLIRERASIATENQKLKSMVADLRVINDRDRAMLEMGDQCAIMWETPKEEPSVIGKLPETCGAPDISSDFLSFDKWMDRKFAALLNENIDLLLSEGVAFQASVKTRVGGVLDVIGSTSGSNAIVKFSDLHGTLEELASLRVDYGKLQRSYAHVERLFSSLPVPAWLKDSTGRLVWVNETYAKALEVEAPDQVVENNMQLFDAEQREILDRARSNGEFFDDLLPATIAGDRRKLRVFNSFDNDGGAGIAIDKSDVDNLNRLLKETNESHSRMLDQLATAVAIFDGSRRLAFYNSSFQKLWQLDPTVLEGNPSHGDVLDILRDSKMLPEHPDWRKWRETQLDIYTAIEPFEEWWHLADGQTIRVAAAPRTEGGSTWIFENVTEKLALESNYNALVRIQGETLDHLNEAVAVFGSNGQLKLFNPALEELWGEDGILVQEGLHISNVVKSWESGAHNNEALQMVLGSVTGFDDARNEYSDRMQLTDDRTLLFTVVPLPDSQTMITFADITASVNFEKALNERAEALEASDQLKSKFLQHVSYKLRAPLTSISGFGEILEAGAVGGLNPKQGEYISHINQSAEELCRIVDDILDLASIDAGTMALEHDTVQLQQTVETAFAGFKDELHEKGLNSEILISPESEILIADPGRLLQIVQNLVSNAINFSPDGGTIRFSAERKAGMHELRISDQGPGIDRENPEKIFDRFETSPGSSGKSGTGLGLSLVRGFVELHGGQIQIDASHAPGTCFVCHLPIEPPQSAGDGLHFPRIDVA